MPDFGRMIDEFVYSLIVMIAGVHWGLQKAVLMAGYTVKLINQWLIENAFLPIIAQTNDSLRVAVGYAFIVALLVLGLTYMLAALVRLDVVSPRNAITWYAAGALFFSIGPSFYQSMNDFRLTIGQVMYLSVLNGLNTHSGDFSSLAQVNANDLGLGPLCDQFDVYLPSATGTGAIDGMDIALAYLRGHAQDVMGYPQPLYSPGCDVYLQNPNPSTWAGASGTSVVPMDWNMAGAYFDHNRSPITWDGLADNERNSAVSWAGASQQRALTAWPLLIFALIEQVVHLLITIAMGITFISFGIAILFAFFKRTESIAHHIINQWIELIVQTTIIALIQALVTGFFLAGAATGSAPAVIGIGMLCLVFILITLWSGVKAVWNSFNRLFNAVSQVAGGVMVAPTTTTLSTVGAGALATGTAVSIGSNALAGMTALKQGATLAQSAGVTLGGSNTLTGVAQTLTRLPSTRQTTLGEVAEQFTEGSMTRRVGQTIPLIGRVAGPLIGTTLLSDRHADQDDTPTVLVPARPRRNSDTDTETVPEQPARTGTFTPDRRGREQSDYHAEMVSEEMEQHISDALRTHTGTHSTLGSTRASDSNRLEQAGDALLRAAQLMLGQLRVTGVQNVAGVMGDVVGQVQTERQQVGQPQNPHIDHLQVGDHMAWAMGVTPQPSGSAPVQQDLARFGLFVDQALRLGLTPQQTEQVIREVQASPEGRLPSATRDSLDKQIQTGQNVSWVKARDEVDRLEHSARMLPPEITAYGMVHVPATTGQPPVNVSVEPNVQVNVQTQDDDYDNAMKRESALGGSGNVT